jgi:N-acetylmuramoyl-L-alanine amidase
MRICLSAGHGLRDPGAENPRLGLNEHVEAYRIAWELRDVLEAEGHYVEFISCFQSLTDKVGTVNRLHAVRPFDLALEIHFNAATNPDARGTEVLHYSAKNRGLAARISKQLSEAIATKDRGAVKRDNLAWLKRTNPPALIIETLFLHNDHEARKIQEPPFHSKVAQAIAKGLAS